MNFFKSKFYQHEKQERKEAQLPAVIQSEPMPRSYSTPGAWKTFSVYLKDRNLNPMLAMANGWYPSTDANDSEFRIVIPGTNSRGYNYWQARAVNKDAKIRYQSPRTPRTDSIIAVYPARTAWSAVVLCEGPMDALSAADHGFISVALMGNQPSAEVLSYVVSHTKATLFYVVAHSDAVGAAAITAAHLASVYKATVKTLLTYPYKDLAACPIELRKVILESL